MILLGVLDLIFGLINVIFTSLNIPSMSNYIVTMIKSAIDYCMSGVSILSYFAGEFVFTLFVLLMSVEAIYRVYTFVMWIIKKLPISSE